MLMLSMLVVFCVLRDVMWVVFGGVYEVWVCYNYLLCIDLCN